MWVLQPLKLQIILFFYWGVYLWYLSVRVIRSMVHDHIVGPLRSCGVFSGLFCCKKFAFLYRPTQYLRLGTQHFLTTFFSCGCVPHMYLCICTVVALCKFRMHNKYVEFTTHKVFFCDEIFLSVW